MDGKGKNVTITKNGSSIDYNSFKNIAKRSDFEKFKSIDEFLKEEKDSIVDIIIDSLNKDKSKIKNEIGANSAKLNTFLATSAITSFVSALKVGYTFGDKGRKGKFFETRFFKTQAGSEAAGDWKLKEDVDINYLNNISSTAYKDLANFARNTLGISDFGERVELKAYRPDALYIDATSYSKFVKKFTTALKLNNVQHQTEDAAFKAFTTAITNSFDAAITNITNGKKIDKNGADSSWYTAYKKMENLITARTITIHRQHDSASTAIYASSGSGGIAAITQLAGEIEQSILTDKTNNRLVFSDNISKNIKNVKDEYNINMITPGYSIIKNNKRYGDINEIIGSDVLFGEIKIQEQSSNDIIIDNTGENFRYNDTGKLPTLKTIYNIRQNNSDVETPLIDFFSTAQNIFCSNVGERLNEFMSINRNTALSFTASTDKEREKKGISPVDNYDDLRNYLVQNLSSSTEYRFLEKFKADIKSTNKYSTLKQNFDGKQDFPLLNIIKLICTTGLATEEQAAEYFGFSDIMFYRGLNPVKFLKEVSGKGNGFVKFDAGVKEKGDTFRKIKTPQGDYYIVIGVDNAWKIDMQGLYSLYAEKYSVRNTKAFENMMNGKQVSMQELLEGSVRSTYASFNPATGNWGNVIDEQVQGKDF